MGIKWSNHKFIKIQEEKRHISKSSWLKGSISIFNVYMACWSAYGPEMSWNELLWPLYWRFGHPILCEWYNGTNFVKKIFLIFLLEWCHLKLSPIYSPAIQHAGMCFEDFNHSAAPSIPLQLINTQYHIILGGYKVRSTWILTCMAGWI